MLYRLGSRAPTGSPAEHHPVSGSILSPGRKMHLAGLYSGYSSLTYQVSTPACSWSLQVARPRCYHLLHHLSASAAGPRTPLAKWHALCNECFQVAIYTSRVPGRALDRKYLLGIPARTYYSVPGWLGTVALQDHALSAYYRDEHVANRRETA